jgi:solute carrier family 25 carnitine/acylcarnitine transporter 20/29
MNFESFISGSIGGASGILISYPLDTIKTYHQVKNTTSIFQATKQIVKQNGIHFINRGLYRGLTTPLIGMGFEKAIVFGVQTNIEKLKLFSNQYMNTFISGVISGLACGIVVTPIEKIKILMQNGHTYDSSIKSIFNNTYKNSFINLYRGYSATMIREGLGFGIYFTIYNLIKNNHSLFFTQEYNPLHATIYGAISGTSAWAIMFPSDQIKTIQQYENKTFSNAIRKIYFNYGISGFYRGYFTALSRAAILHAGVFGGIEVFNILKKTMK